MSAAVAAGGGVCPGDVSASLHIHNAQTKATQHKLPIKPALNWEGYTS